MASRPDIDHPSLGRLQYEEKLDRYTANVMVTGRPVQLRIRCDGVGEEPSAIAHAVQIAGNIDELSLAAKECAVSDLLELKNESWRAKGEPKVSEAMLFKLMKLGSIVVFSDGRAQFYYSDSDMFWGHTIIVRMGADQRFHDAHLAG